jgi:hypothetical protein
MYGVAKIREGAPGLSTNKRQDKKPLLAPNVQNAYVSGLSQKKLEALLDNLDKPDEQMNKMITDFHSYLEGKVFVAQAASAINSPLRVLFLFRDLNLIVRSMPCNCSLQSI